MLRTLLFLAITSIAVAAQEPRAVAEEVLVAWRTADAERIDAVAHPELKKRIRHSRLLEFYLEDKAQGLERRARVEKSEKDALRVFCEALRTIRPQDDRFDHRDRFIETQRKGDLAIVVFESRFGGRQSDPATWTSIQTEIVLKQLGEEWRFLWSASVSIHVDLEWDPRRG